MLLKDFFQIFPDEVNRKTIFVRLEKMLELPVLNVAILNING